MGIQCQPIADRTLHNDEGVETFGRKLVLFWPQTGVGLRFAVHSYDTQPPVGRYDRRQQLFANISRQKPEI